MLKDISKKNFYTMILKAFAVFFNIISIIIVAAIYDKEVSNTYFTYYSIIIVSATILRHGQEYYLINLMKYEDPIKEGLAIIEKFKKKLIITVALISAIILILNQKSDVTIIVYIILLQTYIMFKSFYYQGIGKTKKYILLNNLLTNLIFVIFIYITRDEPILCLLYASILTYIGITIEEFINRKKINKKDSVLETKGINIGYLYYTISAAIYEHIVVISLYISDNSAIITDVVLLLKLSFAITVVSNLYNAIYIPNYNSIIRKVEIEKLNKLLKKNIRICLKLSGLISLVMIFTGYIILNGEFLYFGMSIDNKIIISLIILIIANYIHIMTGPSNLILITLDKQFFVSNVILLSSFFILSFSMVNFSEMSLIICSVTFLVSSIFVKLTSVLKLKEFGIKCYA